MQLVALANVDGSQELTLEEFVELLRAAKRARKEAWKSSG